MNNKVFQVVLMSMILFMSACFSQASSNQGCAGCSKTEPRPHYSFVELEGFVQDTAVISGSGSVIQSDPTGSHILTAAHVCDFLTPDLPTPDETVADLFTPYLKLTATFFDGTTVEVVPVNKDDKSDLCIVKANGVTAPALKISRTKIQTGDRIKTVSSPQGMSGAGRVFYFEGFYAGPQNLGEKWGMGAIYALQSDFGSSGSPILDEHNRIVGIVSRIANNTPQITVSPTQEDLTKFVQDTLNPKPQSSD